jgi:hypothetical protein
MLHAARRGDAPTISVLRSFSLVAWGNNAQGQCGVPSLSPLLLAPQEVSALAGVPLAALAAGKAHSAAVSSAGEVWAFGEGGSGQLGLGRSESAFVPQRVEALVGRAHVCGVALGRRHTLLLDAAGAVFACGDNAHGSLGVDAGPSQGGGGGAHEGRHAGGAALGGVGAGPAQAQARGGRGEGGRGWGGGAAQQAQQAALDRAAEWTSGQGGWSASHLMPMLDHRQRGADIEAAQSM